MTEFVFVRPGDIENLDLARGLLREYYESRGYDAALEDYEEGLRELPGEFSEPLGCLVLALYEKELAGCIGLRKIDDDYCEMKRLYVSPSFRGKKIGYALVGQVVEQARDRGYRFIRLDNHPWMREAESIYGAFGFYSIGAYRYNPTPGTKFFECDLKKYNNPGSGKVERNKPR